MTVVPILRAGWLACTVTMTTGVLLPTDRLVNREITWSRAENTTVVRTGKGAYLASWVSDGKHREKRDQKEKRLYLLSG